MDNISARASDELGCCEEKIANLSKVKLKLEQSLDEVTIDKERDLDDRDKDIDRYLSNFSKVKLKLEQSLDEVTIDKERDRDDRDKDIDKYLSNLAKVKLKL